MPEPSDSEADLVLALVHEGWDHLKHARPLAAWASWRRALRVEPEQRAATHALRVLANAGDLPEAARAEYRFLPPIDEAHRAAWDAAFRGRDLVDLAVAAFAFGDLGDDHARYNQGLCLAWLGRNAEAIDALDRAVDGLAGRDFEVAVRACTLSEILRQGGGAESRADDLNHIATLAWTPGDDPAGFLDDRPDVRAIPHPVDPVTGAPRLSGARLYEWLDRPTSGGYRRVRATLVRSPRSLRLSCLDPALLEGAIGEVLGIAGDRVEDTIREASPLPLAFLDAAVWSIRLPDGADAEDEARINRSAVERYYEDTWINRPRKGLGGMTPIVAAGSSATGDLATRARLVGVIRLREQLGMRPTTALLYQGYPFDRLRRRLGLAPADPDALDPLDATSMGGEELDKLDPSTLDDYALAEAYESAAALGDDRRTARFADVLAGRDPSAMARLDVRALFATLVRREVADDSPSGALGRVDRAQAVDLALTGGADRRAFEVWRAEILVRVGQPVEAVGVYESLIHDPDDPALAVEAVEMLHDAGFEDQARQMARKALEMARTVGDEAVVERARTYLGG